MDGSENSCCCRDDDDDLDDEDTKRPKHNNDPHPDNGSNTITITKRTLGLPAPSASSYASLKFEFKNGSEP